MSDFGALYQRSMFFTPDQQDLLFATLSSTDQLIKPQAETTFDGMPVKTQHSPPQHHQNGSSSHELFDSPSDAGAPNSNRMSLSDESPFMDFSLYPDFEAAGGDSMIGELPGSESREKRKSMDGKEEEESGKKRKENEEKVAKKPGRKPLTSEPTSKRKAQNRAAQRAFRERKEKHLKDLETKVEDLEKASQTANNENNLLRAQIERLQVELREYRKRLSFMGSGHSYPMLSNPPSRQGDLRASRPNGDFSFEFPKFGDLPGAHMFNTGSFAKNQGSPGSQISPNAAIQYRAPGIMSRDILKGANSLGRSPQFNTSSSQSSGTKTQDDSFRPFYNHGPGATLQNPMNSRLGNGMVVKPAHSAVDQTQRQGSYASRKSVPQGTSNTNSPSTSSESPRGRTSSIGTSPEPTATSPSTAQKGVINLTSTGNQARSLDECEKSFYERLNEACGCAEDPVPVALSRSKENSHSSNQQSNAENNGENPLGLDWLIQQNGGQFDPVLFNDYREPQDAVLSQEFGSFFNDAFPLPDLSNSFPNFDLGNSPTPKPNLISQLDRSLEADEEVVPGEDRSQMLSCTKIWDRLQSMEKFRNGEIDVDSLCTELRTKARCSEGGVVVNEKDVEDIMTRAA